MDTKKKRHEDCGEKITGARKDLYMARGGLSLDDLETMDEREYAKHVVKSNIWPTPDYKAMLSEGYTPLGTYFVKQIRDSLPAKPVGYKKEYLKIYIDLINVYREACKSYKDETMILKAYEIIVKTAEEMDFEYLRYKEHKKPLLTTRVGARELNEMKVEVEIQDFPNNFSGKLKGLTIYSYYDGGYAIVQNKRMVDGFKRRYSTREEALKVLKEEVVPKLLNEKKETTKKDSDNKLIRPQLEHIERTGPDYRNGKDVTGEDMLERFLFRGIEYGNWNTQADRQACINFAYDSMLDLSHILYCSKEFISLGGYKDKRLALAFGSRGVSGALAHYEPSNVVINLTKMRGAGALAHEWGHALDDFIGIKCGFPGLFSRYGEGAARNSSDYKYPEIQDSFRKLLSTMKHTEQTLDEMLADNVNLLENHKSRMSRHADSLSIGYIRDRKNGYRKATDNEKSELNEALELLRTNIDHDSLEKVNKVHKSISNRLPSKEFRDTAAFIISNYNYVKNEIENIKNGKPTHIGKKYTHFYDNAKKIDKLIGKNYAQTSVELFARAFESYVEDSLRKIGRKNDYLVHSTFNDSYNHISAYPAREERELINAEMEKFLKLVVTTFSEYNECEEDDFNEGLDTKDIEAIDALVAIMSKSINKNTTEPRSLENISAEDNKEHDLEAASPAIEEDGNEIKEETNTVDNSNTINNEETTEYEEVEEVKDILESESNGEEQQDTDTELNGELDEVDGVNNEDESLEEIETNIVDTSNAINNEETTEHEEVEEVKDILESESNGEEQQDTDTELNGELDEVDEINEDNESLEETGINLVDFLLHRQAYYLDYLKENSIEEEDNSEEMREACMNLLFERLSQLN